MGRIETMVGHIIGELYDDGNPNKAVLANLRNAPTLNAPRAQKVVPLLMQHLEKRDLSRTGAPTRVENAVYTALRLYALHQQSNDYFVYAQAPHRRGGADDESESEGLTLFAALARLNADSQNRSNIDRRVEQALATTRLDTLTNSLNHLVSSLRRSRLRVDYARLGEELYQFQFGYEAAGRVRFVWAQDYYYQREQLKSTEGATNHDN